MALGRCQALVLSLSIVGIFTHILAGAASAQGYLTPPAAPVENPVTAEKAVLGKILFWDEQLSSDGSIACGTCHIPSEGSSDPRVGVAALNPGSDGIFGTSDDITGSPGVLRANGFGHLEPDPHFGLKPQVTGRRAPSSIMAAYFDDLFWDGRAKGKFTDPSTGLVVMSSGGALESQSLGPVLSDVEMGDSGRTLDDLLDRIARVRPLALATDLPSDTQVALLQSPSYPELFQQAFGTPDVTAVRIAFALATYQRTLIPDQTPWDDFQRGIPNSLTPRQQRGMVAFETTAICAVCHTPPTFMNNDYHSLALRPSYEDEGRMDVTGNAQDRAKFKTPSLRNVDLRSRWFHNGDPSITDLRGTVAIYANGIGGGFDQLDPVLNGLLITDAEVDDITEFLHALTDPRVAAETYPFDRPTLRSERGLADMNPMPLGMGAVVGTGGVPPRALIEAAPFYGADGFRIGLDAPVGQTFAAMRMRLRSKGGLPSHQAIRSLGLPTRAVAVAQAASGTGYGTWHFPLVQTPAIVGLALDVQWWVRDPQAAGNVARSELLRITVE